jgi:ectoine hydroxylase-related dioxygenase (phytanoyl-CoA dioxygenase family)
MTPDPVARMRVAARRRFDEDGYAIVADVVPQRVCAALLDAISRSADRGAGSRTLLDLPEVMAVARDMLACDAVAALLPDDAVAVQCTLFVKDARSNWTVAPHQDLSVPLAERIDVQGWAGWSRKQGAWFAQPPESVLASMVAVRLQLDPAHVDGGALRVVRGSHRAGRLAMAAMPAADAACFDACVVERGGALAMRPLLVHASGRTATGVARRVLHFLFGPPRLPSGMRWATEVH